MTTNREDLNGIVVTWDMSGPEVPLSEIHSALSKAGIQAETNLRKTSVLGRAIKHMRTAQDHTILVDKLRGRNSNPKFQLTDKHTDDACVTYTEGLNVELDLEEGKALCNNERMQEEINDQMAYADSHRTAQDISNMVKRLFQSNADLYAINPRKGVAYFVPKEHMDFAEKIQTFLQAIGGNLWSFPVPRGDEAGDKSVKDAIDQGLNALLSDLEKSVEAWGEDTGARAIKTANERWAMAAAKIEAYTVYLQDNHAVLEERLNAARHDMQAKIVALGKE